MRYQCELPSPVGQLRLFASDEQLIGLYFEDHAPTPKDTTGKKDDGPFHAATTQLQQYFGGERDEFDLPILFQGTEFQAEVWTILQTIQIGTTMSYGEIATACGRPQAMRAVGAAVGRNPISIIVPCHRVIGASGSLTGFAGGLERKRWLLDREHAIPTGV